MDIPIRALVLAAALYIPFAQSSVSGTWLVEIFASPPSSPLLVVLEQANHALSGYQDRSPARNHPVTGTVFDDSVHFAIHPFLLADRVYQFDGMLVAADSIRGRVTAPNGDLWAFVARRQRESPRP